MVRAQKTDVSLAEYWWVRVPKTGKPTHFWNPITGESISARDVEVAPPGFLPCVPRQIEIAPGIFIFAKDSYIDIRINNLFADRRSRYQIALDAMEKASRIGIFQYPRSSNGQGSSKKSIKKNLIDVFKDQRRRREAYRHNFRKKWRVADYEHDLLILDPQIGQMLLKELKSHDTSGHNEWATIYLKGFHTTKYNVPNKVHVYEMILKRGPAIVKIEVTLRRDFLKNNRHLRRINNLHKQPDIQKLIERTLRREWKSIFRKAPESTQLLMDRTGCTSIKKLLDHLLDPENTLTHYYKKHKDSSPRLRQLYEHLSST